VRTSCEAMLYYRERLYCMTSWACEMYMVWHERAGRQTAKRTVKKERPVLMIQQELHTKPKDERKESVKRNQTTGVRKRARQISNCATRIIRPTDGLTQDGVDTSIEFRVVGNLSVFYITQPFLALDSRSPSQ
jgi:hypothetical protein